MSDNEEKKEPTTGYLMVNGKPTSIKIAGPDHPIYQKGFIVGGHYTKRNLKENQEKPSEEPKSE